VIASEIVAGARVDANLLPIVSRVTCGLTATLMVGVMKARAKNILCGCSSREPVKIDLA
jgi:hypothetical protein